MYSCRELHEPGLLYLGSSSYYVTVPRSAGHAAGKSQTIPNPRVLQTLHTLLGSATNEPSEEGHPVGVPGVQPACDTSLHVVPVFSTKIFESTLQCPVVQ